MFESLIASPPPPPMFGVVKVIKNPYAMTVNLTAYGDAMTLHYSDPDTPVIKTFNNSTGNQTFDIPANITEFYLKTSTPEVTLYNLVLYGTEITSITWNRGLRTIALTFYFNPKLIEVSPYLPKSLTQLNYTFSGCTLFNGDISDWDTSEVTLMSSVFGGASSFNQDISSWNTSKVTTLNSMFSEAKAFNKDIGSWDTSRVTDMTQTFNGCTVFNQDITNWNTRNVTVMTSMFRNASSFNQNLSNWDVSKVTNRTNFDTGATAWQADFKPKFT